MQEGLERGRARTKRTLVSHVAGGETVVVPVPSKHAGQASVYALNESGTTLWAMLEAGLSLAELACGLQSEYGLTPDEALEDARQFVESLMREGLVEPV